MEISGFEGGGLSEGSKKALQSETWKKVRKVMKTEIEHFTATPEIQHFATKKVSKSDNVYGVVWGNVVREYLKTAYARENMQAEIVLDGIVYKVLNRGQVTAFYDSDGNTLFDVENKRLEKEYGYVMKEEKPEEKSGNDVSVNEIVSSDPASVKQMAKEKLEKEMKADKNKTFAEPVIGYLLKRCEEDFGLAQDVVQEHKTWKKCFDYIYEQARKQATGNRAAVRDEVVYEWAEDYYHKDDKAEEAEKARKAAETKKKAAERAAKAKKNVGSPKTENKAVQKKQKSSAPAEKIEDKKIKRNSKNLEGQMDLFSMMGM